MAQVHGLSVALIMGLIGTVGGASPAGAQVFQCTEATAGQLTCQAGTSCECGFAQASAMAGLPSGWRWDCGILRPRCENLPATIGDSGPLPETLSITDQSVTVQQNAGQRIQWIAPDLDF